MNKRLHGALNILLLCFRITVFFSLRHWTKLRFFNVYFFLSDSDAYWMWVCVIMREHKLCLPSVCDFSLSLVGFKYSVLLCSPLQWVRIDNTQTRDLCVLTVRHLYSFVFVPFIVLCIISYQPKRFAFALKTFDNLVCLSSISGPNSGLIE